MNIHEVLGYMGITHRCCGNLAFKTLGLAEANLDVPFCTFIADLKYAEHISPNAKVVLIPQELKDKFTDKGVCIVEDPRRTFFQLHNFLSTYSDYIRQDKPTRIESNCVISPLAHIAKKNVLIGNNVVIEEFVSIKENVVIGDNCVIRTGSILGGEGFEFKRDENGNLFGVKHLGGVIVSDNVEIQQAACIDRAVYPWDNTKIGAFSKIDNLVHIAHGVKIGQNTMIVANTGIGGRVVIGDDCWIGFGVTIRNGITIENNVRANMGAVVTKNINAGEAVTGNFAIPHDQFLQNLKASLKNVCGGDSK